MRYVGIVDTFVHSLIEVEISSPRIEHRVAVKLREGLDDDVETDGDDGQGGEGDQEAEHVRPGDPVKTTVGTSDTVNPELVHPILSISEMWNT